MDANSFEVFIPGIPHPNVAEWRQQLRFEVADTVKCNADRPAFDGLISVKIQTGVATFEQMFTAPVIADIVNAVTSILRQANVCRSEMDISFCQVEKNIDLPVGLRVFVEYVMTRSGACV